jgi:hypothetical protein
MRKRITAALAVFATAATIGGAPASAGRSTEPAYYDGSLVHFQIPSSDSANGNQFTNLCYNLGPDITQTPRRATAQLWVLFVPGATQHACPDGSWAHDHVLSAVPGSPDYTGAWTVNVVVAGPNFDMADMPYTSVAAVQAGIAAGKLTVLFPTAFELLAPVLG